MTGPIQLQIRQENIMNSERNITNDLVTEYINGFYAPLTPELGALRTESEEKKVPIILKETESFLDVMLKITAPKRILEIGCAVGYSAMFFAESCGADVITIEKDHDMAAVAAANFEKLGYSGKVRVIEADGEEGTNQLIEAGEEPFDMVFIDAAKSHYKRFLEAALPLCKAGTVIISDNVLFKARIASDEYDPTGKHKTNIKKMREYLDFINEDPRMSTTVVACGDGLSISKIL